MFAMAELIVLGVWLLIELTLFLIIYGAVRLALKHDHRSRGL